MEIVDDIWYKIYYFPLDDLLKDQADLTDIYRIVQYAATGKLLTMF